MTTFFIDLWHDLRERRLWPVAVGLLAAIVAVPAILFKPVSNATPPSAAAPKPTGVATLPVVNVESGPIRGSKLESFRASEKNPFKPMKDPSGTPEAKPAAGATGSAATSRAGGSGGSDSTAGSSGSSGGGSVSGGSPGGSSTPSSSGGSTPSGSSAPSTQWFRYAADFSFGKTGKKAEVFKSVANFTLLPNETTPAVVFLGAGADG